MFRFLFILVLVTSLISPGFAESDLEQCLVIGQEADPARGRALFKTAMDAWHRGKISMAVDHYERAIIADHSILKHEDHGMAMKLLEKYRNMPDNSDMATLCRRAFLENILIGNLETSIRIYQEAAGIAGTEKAQNLAMDEASRLKGQLDYIRNWQKGILRDNRINRAQDLSAYLERSRIDEIQDQVEDNSAELEELNERLTYLQKQEKEISEEMYSSVGSASRYRRRYLYPGAYQDNSPSPDPSVFPEGNFGDEGLNTAQVPNPYAGQASNSNRTSARNRFYIYRNRANRQKDQLAQIRAEISGVYRKIAEISKANRELREKASGDPVR